jgi:CO dehydrogenase nickel-insertion accessory protein CooC1
MATVLQALRAGHDLVVVDLARHVDEAARVTLTAADLTLLVVPADVRAVAAAGRVAAAAAPLTADLRLVVRGPAPSGLGARTVATALALPLVGWLRPDHGLSRAMDLGQPPGWGGRGSFTDLSRVVLRALDRRSMRQAVA